MRSSGRVLEFAALLCACGSGGGSASVGARQYQISVTVVGSGAIQLSTGDNCRDHCTVAVADGVHLTATATPDPGSQLSAWSGACSGAGACDFTVGHDIALAAAFAPKSAPPVDTSPAPHAVILLEGGRSTGPAPLVVRLDASSSTCVGGVCSSIDWDFGDGTPHGSQVQVSHTYPSPGVFTAALRVFDSAGRTGTSTATITVETPPLPNPIFVENAQPGDAWEIARAGRPGELEGYAGQVSVQHGDSIELHARADAPHTLTWDVFRMGYYGGAGARRLANGGPVQVGPQATPAADPGTGRVECAWPTTFRVQTQTGWTSGIYLVRLTRDDGIQHHVIVVVRADERKGAAVVQASVTTWQAYNDWGGESLYTTSTGQPGGFAKEVSFERPYSDQFGTGEFLYYEFFFVLWAESRGYDLTYVTNVDLDRDPSLLDGQKLYLSVGHDEYWSLGERSAVEKAISRGVNVAFLSADNLEWQIRLEGSATGAVRRTEVCHKGMASDPLSGTPLETTHWRSAALGRPENELIGVMYDSYQKQSFPFVAANTSHWVYAGTGVKDGDALAPIVGYEFDRVFDNGRTPPNLVVLARSPVVGFDGTPGVHNASIYTASSGAWVFAAGTIEWSWGLAGGLGPHSLADRAVQRMTANLFERAGLPASSPGATFGAP